MIVDLEHIKDRLVSDEDADTASEVKMIAENSAGGGRYESFITTI